MSNKVDVGSRLGRTKSDKAAEINAVEPVAAKKTAHPEKKDLRASLTADRKKPLFGAKKTEEAVKPKKAEKKKAERKRKAAPVKTEQEIRPSAAADVDEEQDLDTFLLKEEIEEAEREERRSRFFTKTQLVLTAVLSIGCVYLLILIYGVLMTTYQYEPTGDIKPQSMSVEELRDKNNFDYVMSGYIKGRDLYETSVIIYEQYSMQYLPNAEISTKYKALQTDAVKLYKEFDAMSEEPQYAQIVSMMCTWMETMNHYAVNMAEGLSEQNASKVSEGEAFRSDAIDEFGTISQNILTIGSGIKGVDLTDVSSWSEQAVIDAMKYGE